MTYWKSVCLVFLGACSYGILSTFVKLAYDRGFTVNGVTGSQMLFGLVMLLVLTRVTHRWERLRIKQWLKLAFAGSFIGWTAIFYYASLIYTEASFAVILLFQFTWIGVLLEWLLDKKKPTGPVLLSLLLLFLGTLTASGLLLEGMPAFSFRGVFFGLLAAFSYAGFIMSSGRISVEVNPWMRSTVMLVGSLVITCIVFPPTFIFDGSLGQGLWLWGLLLAFFGMVVPTLFFTMGVPTLGSGLSTILGSAELPTAVLMSWLVLHEHVGGWEWFGVFLILTGIAVGQQRSVTRSERVSG